MILYPLSAALFGSQFETWNPLYWALVVVGVIGAVISARRSKLEKRIV